MAPTTFAWVRLTAVSQPAERSILDWRNSTHVRLPDHSAQSILLQITSDGLVIGTENANVSLPGKFGGGWIARQHCSFYASTSGILLENHAASQISYSESRVEAKTVLSKNERHELRHGGYNLHLAEEWDFELFILPPEDAQGQIFHFLESALPEVRRYSRATGDHSPIDRKGIASLPVARKVSLPHKGRKEVAIAAPRNEIILHWTKATLVKLIKLNGRGLVKKECLDKKRANAWISEVNLLKDMRHKNIISLVDFCKRPLPVLTTTFIGPDLASFQDGHHMSTFTEEERHIIEEQFIDIAMYLKKMRVVHRDIKPQNVLFSRHEQRVVLIDFGLACLAEKCNSKADYGTPCFLPPEVSIGAKRSHGGDIWAMGVVLLFVHGYIRGNFKTWNLKEDAVRFAEHGKWLMEVEKQRLRLPGDSVVRQMLEPEPSMRVHAENLSSKTLLLPA